MKKETTNITLMSDADFQQYKEDVEQEMYRHIRALPTLQETLEEEGKTATPFGERLLATLSNGRANVYNIVSNHPFFTYFFDSTKNVVASTVPGLMMAQMVNMVTAESLTDLKQDDLNFMKISLGQLAKQMDIFEQAEKEGNTSKVITYLSTFVPTPLQFPIYQLREAMGYFEGKEEHALELLMYMYNQAEYGFVQDGENIYIDAFERIAPFLTESSPYHVSHAKGYHEKEMIVYRGVGSKSTPIEENPMSWTTDEEVAHFFATRFDDAGTVIKGKVATKDILFYVDDRNEREVIVESRNVKVINEYEVLKKEKVN